MKTIEQIKYNIYRELVNDGLPSNSDNEQWINGIVQKAIDAIQGWIPIEEELPPIGEFEDVSIHVHVTDGKLIGHGTYDYDRKLWTYYLITQAEQNDNEITHWMPLIKLPEKQSRP